MPGTADDADPNVRSTKYLIVASRILCMQCSTVTKVFALALPAGYESLYVNDDTPGDESETTDPRHSCVETDARCESGYPLAQPTSAPRC
jgi:hypothetical protein